MDDELICNLDDCVEIFSDCVKVSLPEVRSFVLSDDQLDYLSEHDSAIIDFVNDFDISSFWVDLFSCVRQMRDMKRNLYEGLGFSEY